MTRTCIEPDCNEPAGTPWTPLWCAEHDQERRDRITRGLEEIVTSFKGTGSIADE